jgi:hypothetical protein
MGYRSGQNSRFDNPQNPTAASLSVKHRFDPPVCNQLNTIDMSNLFQTFGSEVNGFMMNPSLNGEIKQKLRDELIRFTKLLKSFPPNSVAFSENDKKTLLDFYSKLEEGSKTSNHKQAMEAIIGFVNFYEKKVKSNI